jgi:hypothetical protein
VATAARTSASSANDRIVTIDMFSSIPSRTIADSTPVVITGGYSAVGRGSAFYINDVTATAALAIAHPMFCVTSKNGRVFRAMPDAEGLIAVSAGGVIGTDTVDHTVNHQPGIQAALNYAKAIGAKGIRFDKMHYSVWTPLRTFGTRQLDLDLSGIPIVIAANAELRAAAGGTILHRRKRDGSDPAIFAGTQQLTDGSWWRGGMIVVAGPKTVPVTYQDRPTLILRGTLTLDGGLPISGQTTYSGPGTADPYPLNLDGSLWDISDKGISHPSSYYNGDLVFDGQIRVDGFRGELIFQSSVTQGSIYQTGKLELSNSDGDGFNPGPGISTIGEGRIHAQFIHIHHVRQAMEGACGRASSNIARLLIEDCTTAGGLLTGRWGDAPTAGAITPTLTMANIHVERSANYVVHHGNQIGKLTCIDSYVDFGATNIDCYNTTVDTLTVIADRAAVGRAVGIYAASAGGSFNNRIRHLHCDLTAYAQANAKAIGRPVDWNGILGSGNYVDRMTGRTSGPASASNYAASTGYSVGFGNVDMDGFAGAGNALQNVETTPTLTYAYGHYVTLTTTTLTGLFPVTLPAASGKFQAGSRMRVLNGMGSAVMAVQTTNTRMSRRYLLRPNTVANFEFDGSAWLPLNPYPVLSGAVTATLLKSAAVIPAGDVSDEVTLTISGAKAGMHVSVTPNATINADAMLMGRVSADNTVAIRVRNANLSTTLSLGPQTYIAQLTYIN